MDVRNPSRSDGTYRVPHVLLVKSATQAADALVLFEMQEMLDNGAALDAEHRTAMVRRWRTLPVSDRCRAGIDRWRPDETLRPLRLVATGEVA